MDREQRLQNSRRVQDPYSKSPRQCVLLGFSLWHFVTRQNGTTCILGYRSGRPVDREKHTRSKTDMLYGRCGEFLEVCCAISCCMRPHLLWARHASCIHRRGCRLRARLFCACWRRRWSRRWDCVTQGHLCPGCSPVLRSSISVHDDHHW